MNRIESYNPEVLKWARKRTGKIDTKEFRDLKPKILEWEEKISFPTYKQLERLSDIYNIPVAVFFFPEPPEVETKRPEFRSLNNLDLDDLPYQLNRVIDRAPIIQQNLKELLEDSNKGSIKFLDKVKGKSRGDLIEFLREKLKVNIDEQAKLKPDELLKRFREALFSLGIYVFKNPFHEKTVSGFCVYDDNYPVIFLNSSMSKTRQLFTLFHEIYHLLNKISSIDCVDYTVDKNNIERDCDQFAAEFLIPEDRLIEKINDESLDLKKIVELAKYFSVSLEAILIRLIKLNYLNWSAFNNYKEQMRADNYPDYNKGKSGGNPYYNLISYLGNNYVNLAYDAYRSGKIDELELCDYLGLKASQLDSFESHWRE